MATEMAPSFLLSAPDAEFPTARTRRPQAGGDPVATPTPVYERVDEIAMTPLRHGLASGHPEDAIDLSKAGHVTIDWGFIGSCTTRMTECARRDVLRGRKVAPASCSDVPATMTSGTVPCRGPHQGLQGRGAWWATPLRGCAAGRLAKRTGRGDREHG
jgi:homoaconitase/3-isopropylmalate dehydratase large subunit